MAYKKRVIMLWHFTHHCRDKGKSVFICLGLYMYSHVFIYCLLHIARIFTSCQSSTICSVRTSCKTATTNYMIQYSKFHFLILFREIIICTFFFTYIALLLKADTLLKLIQYIKEGIIIILRVSQCNTEIC